MNKNKIINISNSLSFLRLLLALPLCLLILDNQNIAALIVALSAMLTDALDGYFARKRNEVTEFGKIIDPVADKVIIGAVVLVLIFKGMVPIWFVIAVLTRDLLILLGGLYLTKKLGFVVYSDFVGKISVFILSLVLIIIVLKFDNLIKYSMYFALVALIVSLVNYVLKMIMLINNKKR